LEIDRKAKLVNLGPEVLADALLELEQQSKLAVDMTDRLLATPKENLQRFRAKMAGIKRMKRFVTYRETAVFAQRLEMLLGDLRAAVTDPLKGLELLISFYEADGDILGNCDDSSGNIGDVFRYDAAELFIELASQCEDKNRVADLVLNACLVDDYGVRDCLIDNAGKCLPESAMRRMVDELQKLVTGNDHRLSHFLILIESLARQLKDPKLFEKTRMARWNEITPAMVNDIAKVYLEAQDIDSAWEWLQKYPEGATFQSYERDQLLQQIYRLRGETEKLAALLLFKLQEARSVSALNELLDVVGHDKYSSVVDKEARAIVSNADFCETSAEFLVDVGKIEEAEAYVLARVDKIKGDYYGSLLSLAEKLEPHNCNLAVSIVYRSLLMSILKRSYAKAYHHAVKYLKKLDDLSDKISDWRNLTDHAEFKANLFSNHSRKWKFWSEYESARNKS